MNIVHKQIVGNIVGGTCKKLSNNFNINVQNVITVMVIR